MLTMRVTFGRRTSSRFSSVTPKTTWRMTSRVTAFMRSRVTRVPPSCQDSTSAFAMASTRGRYAFIVGPENAGISSLRERRCSSSSTIRSECEPMTGSRMALPSPAWNCDGSAAKISLTSAGSLKITNVRGPGRILIEKVSPKRSCSFGIIALRSLRNFQVVHHAGQRGPAGIPRVVSVPSSTGAVAALMRPASPRPDAT